MAGRLVVRAIDEAQSVRWYLRYGLSYRDLEEMLEERGVFVDHTSIFRWVIRLTPQLEAEFRKRKAPVGGRWRMDETYVKVKGQHRYLYRAVDKTGNTIDFLLTARRDRAAALRFLRKAIDQNSVPELINIDKSGANTAGIEDYNAAHEGVEIEIRQCKYLNNLVEQDHRNIKRRTRPMAGFKSFRAEAFGQSNRTLVRIADEFDALAFEGLELAFHDTEVVIVDGKTPDGTRASREIRVAGPGAFVLLKARALRGRGENKDAYDLQYVVRNWPKGSPDIAARVNDLVQFASARKALAWLRADFETVDHMGPKGAARFLDSEDDEDLRADIWSALQELLELIDAVRG